MNDPLDPSACDFSMSDALLTLLSKARTHHDTHDGTGMLLYRAEASFKRFDEDAESREVRRWW